MVYYVIILLIYMSGLFVIAQLLRNNSIVDIGWGIGFILIALTSLLKTGLFLPRHLIITLLICMWGMRLSLHLGIRNWKKPEDPRYAAWRREWKKHFYLRSFFQIFMLQGFVMFVIALPIIMVNSSTNQDLTILDLGGTILWCIGFLFETVGDYQLGQFLSHKKNKGKIMQSGLWRYTRHPNYFGEVTLWWGIFIIALSVQYGWISIVSPLTITYLLLFVSGIPMTEKLFSNNSEYEQYKQATSAFIPWPRQKLAQP